MYLPNNNFLHIGITFAGAQKVRELEPWVQSVCQDWVRYGGNNWIIWTNRSPMAVADAIQPALAPADLLLVAKLETQGAAGYLPQWIWDWINRPRPPGWTPPPPLPPPETPRGLRALPQLPSRGALADALRKMRDEE